MQLWPSGRDSGARLRTAGQAVLSLLVAVFLALQVTAPAAANPRFAAIVVDAKSGKVVFERNADEQRFPASLTKIMTLYLLFEEVKAGRITLDTKLPVSAHAARQPPSNVGLKPGQTIRAEDAIKVLVTKSANDVAAVVGEALSGSVSAFAKRMTGKARELGMTRTTFRNASGLPDPKQVTTARDMATLGLRIQRDFPEMYKAFSLRSYTYSGRSYRNHNGLLGKVGGMDGIKTGYIRASGFNLCASVERDNKRIVAVVMGGRTAASRNHYMAGLIEDMFRTAKLTRSGAIATNAGSPPGLAAAEIKVAGLSPPLPRNKPLTGEPEAAPVVMALAEEGSDDAGERAEKSALGNRRYATDRDPADRQDEPVDDAGHDRARVRRPAGLRRGDGSRHMPGVRQEGARLIGWANGGVHDQARMGPWSSRVVLCCRAGAGPACRLFLPRK